MVLESFSREATVLPTSAPAGIRPGTPYRDILAGARLGLAAAALLAALPAAAAAQVHAGPVVGYSLLERKDTSLSHGPLKDEVTLGRSWLLGGAVEVRLAEHDTLSAEFLYGPYHDDVDRYCIVRVLPGSQERCEPGVQMETTHVVHAGVHYARSFGNGRWRPYAGGGIGLKQYAFRDQYFGPSTRSLVFAGVAGLQAGTRMRLEAAALFVRNNPLLYQLEDRGQFELQVRLVALAF
jgi:hypothetical protein